MRQKNPFMSHTIIQRLESLREEMRREHLDAFIFPSTDAHNSEYPPDHWKGREFISGFTGSAGTAVVTLGEAALWTDSRYFIAAARQLEGTTFQLMRQGADSTPTISQWLGRKLAPVNGAIVGLDGMVNSINLVRPLERELRSEGGITLRTNYNPLTAIWTDRPTIPLNPVEIHPLGYAGETAQNKLFRIRKALREQHIDGMLVSALDDIAWALNLRGTDVHCNPLFVAYLLIAPRSATLFIDPAKITPDVAAYLKATGVATDLYDNISWGLQAYEGYNLLLDPDETPHALSLHAHRPCLIPSPIPAMKAIKNSTEIVGFRRAMLRDGIAMVQFLRWLRPAVERGEVTEITIADKLLELRSRQPLFRDISFDTIAGYGPHGAIVHYEATPQTNAMLQPHGLVLIDSGAQYQDGTTDITRTIALGPLTEEERHAYTLVLKGHIAIETCLFPANTTGTQIDILARQFMWSEGLNYLHGTGHGVGSYLCVHEGPHQIRMEWRPAPLKAGMTVTDEPGLYIEDKFGVRIENTLLTVPVSCSPQSNRESHSADGGAFLGFEPLTLCPIDKEPIDRSMLTLGEIQWLDAYHRQVYDTLAPHLPVDDRQWLAMATSPL